MDFLVADRAVLIPWRPQIVERRRHDAESRSRCGRRARAGQVGVALQANEPDLVPSKHPRIRRSVRLVTARAALELHGRMLECKRSPLIAVTAEAARLVGGERLHHPRTKAPVGVVAIDARHGAFGNPMLERLLKLTPRALVAARA